MGNERKGIFKKPEIKWAAYGAGAIALLVFLGFSINTIYAALA